MLEGPLNQVAKTKVVDTGNQGGVDETLLRTGKKYGDCRVSNVQGSIRIVYNCSKWKKRTGTIGGSEDAKERGLGGSSAGGPQEGKGKNTAGGREETIECWA